MHRLAIVLLMLGIAAGCSDSTRSNAPGAPSSSRGPVVSAEAPAVPEGLMTEWIAFRKAFGLRTDEAWIRRVAVDPTANRDGVPLLPSEIAELQERIDAGQRLQPAIDAYGATVVTDWAGSFVAEGQLIALFTRNTEQHAAILRRLLGPKARFEVRAAEQSLRGLEESAQRVERDAGWLSTIDATLLSVEVVVMDNEIEVRYQGPADLEDKIRAHFVDAGPPEVIHAASNPWNGPYGSLTIEVVDADGRPVSRESVYCDIGSEDPRLGMGKHWEPDPTRMVDDAGRCRLGDGLGRVPAVPYMISILEQNRNGTWTELARGRVTVREGEPTKTTIVVDR